MKPQLSEKERAALLNLGSRNPAELDPFERHIRSEIGRLSMVIDQGQANVDRLKSDVAEAQESLTRDVGAFQATARTFLAYMGTKGEAPIPGAPMATAKFAPAPQGPQEAPGDAEPEPGAVPPSEPETEPDGPDEAPEGAVSANLESK